MNSTYDMSENFNLEISVDKYNKDDNTKEDIIKIVNIKVNYTILDDTKTYELKKLKIKEK